MDKVHNKQQTMLVFAVPYGGSVFSAAHPTEAKMPGYDMPAKLRQQSERTWHKIGTAIQNEDGSLALQLSKIPPTTHLVVRPARPGEAD